MKRIVTSWIIRTYNEEKWLGRVLQALMDQNQQDFEIIIIDSGSTDDTLNIASQFPVQIIKIPHKKFSYSYALNLGITKAKGKFIGILSGHSLPTNKWWYEHGMSNFNDPQVAGVTGLYTSLPDGSWTEKAGDLAYLVFSPKRDEYSTIFTNTNSLIRKDLWTEYPFDENLPGCEDYDWAQEMLARGWKIVKDPRFRVRHSHGGLGRPSFFARKKEWREMVDQINKKTRPSALYLLR